MLRKIKRWIRSYFGFTRNQTNGFLILIPAMLLILFSEPLFEWFRFKNSKVPLEEQRIIDSMAHSMRADDDFSTYSISATPFHFDPNKATRDELHALGFKPYVVQRIVNFRTKGGRFLIKTDLFRIYGIDSLLVARLLPYIQLPEQADKIAEVPKSKETLKSVTFDLNAADTLVLRQIAGIGEVLSKRIVAYRSSLGGFVDKNQLYEVWGLDSAIVAKLNEASFIGPGFEPQKINLNTIAEAQLIKHPYVSKKMARAIITYRFQHGSFLDISDLDKIDQIDKVQLEKAKPYLTIE